MKSRRFRFAFPCLLFYLLITSLSVFHLLYENNLDIVISSCNENLTWLPLYEFVLNPRNVFVYEKCKTTTSHFSFSTSTRMYLTLPNVGREGHTWLHHMLRTDLIFSEYTLFLQGSPEVWLFQAFSALPSSSPSSSSSPPSTNFFRHQRPDSESHEVYEWMTQIDATGRCETKTICERRLREFWQRYKHPTKSDDFESTLWSLKGEMLLSSLHIVDFLASHGRPALTDLLDKLAATNNSFEGHLLERTWESMFMASPASSH
ncbi:hypothetical protein ScalyP_jg6311 [Parmales sp. scaly parma]|nr:hypothetical protein ScalyP_jg6311 [Parmales sp. scaly parma]